MCARTTPIALAICVALVAAVVLGGCSQKAAAPVPAVAAPGTPVAAADLELMSADYKYSYLATDFPVQVPVPNGTVERGERQSPSAWDYIIVVPGGVESVKQWYREAYARADWEIVGETAETVSFQKNAAQSQAKFETANSGADTRVTVTLGVGTPVLQTQ